MSDQDNVTPFPAEKNIYQLQIHENTEIDGAIVTRVPGGWLYSMVEMLHGEKMVLPPVFVPYSEEFKIKVKPNDQH